MEMRARRGRGRRRGKTSRLRGWIVGLVDSIQKNLARNYYTYSEIPYTYP
jgi:hypothetical protein